MPTYGYECKSCGHTFDVFQSMKDDPLKTCPQCGKELRRLINGGSGVIFKGSGFYVTDKGKAGPAKDGGKPAGPEKAAGAAPAGEGKAAAPPAGKDGAPSVAAPAAAPGAVSGGDHKAAAKPAEKKVSGE
ncbi:MAG: zinc ribbon domain-containing protein [Treponema sp.]|jgi:putative FmdB family regulatory protein|nr:zinc ribbon domain-containing protein [Treponema sp.]